MGRNDTTMKKTYKILLIIFLFFTLFSHDSFAADEQASTSQEEVLESQQNSLNIAGFLEEAQKYTEDIFQDVDMNELFNAAITGNIDNTTILQSILNLVGGEILDCISVLGSVIVIIIIHSILKSISDGLENKSVSQITYYVQYILIVTKTNLCV